MADEVLEYDDPNLVYIRTTQVILMPLAKNINPG